MAHFQRATAIALIGASTAWLTACKAKETATAPVPIVPIAIAGPASLANDLTLTAEFRPYQEVDVMAKVAGYVRSIRVDMGDHVRQGAVLATLEAPEIQDDVIKAKAGVAAAEANVVTAQAAIQRAQAGANMAKLSFQRIQQVSEKDKGLVPRQEIDMAQSHSLEATAELASVNSSLKAAEQRKSQAESEYARAVAMNQYTTITAPFTGVVTKRYANTGAMIQAGTSSQTQAMPVVKLAQNDVLRLILPVPVSDVGDVKDGQTVDVNVISLHRALHGKVTRYANTVQSSTRTMDTEVDVPNADGTLVPGMYAEVHLHMAQRPNVLSVPLDAVDGIGTSTQQAWVVRDRVAHMSVVTVGLQTPSRIEILSGLSAGDKVIVGRHTGLAEGQRVEAQTASYETTDNK
jgi:RND family efflux transporter MFP subunit